MATRLDTGRELDGEARSGLDWLRGNVGQLPCHRIRRRGDQRHSHQRHAREPLHLASPKLLVAACGPAGFRSTKAACRICLFLESCTKTTTARSPGSISYFFSMNLNELPRW